MKLTKNVWVDDFTIIINGKTMSLKEAKEFRGLLETVVLSNRNYAILVLTAKSETNRFPSPFDVVKWILRR